MSTRDADAPAVRDTDALAHADAHDDGNGAPEAEPQPVADCNADDESERDGSVDSDALPEAETEEEGV